MNMHELPDVEEREKLQEKLKDVTYLPSYFEIFSAFDFLKHPGSPKGSQSDWDNFCNYSWNPNNSIYEFPTKEHLTTLSSYIARRAGEVATNRLLENVTLLEVAAGSGRMAFFLHQLLKKTSDIPITVIATDKRSSAYPTSTLFPEEMPVENLDYQEALEKYQPHIVLTSWMPPHEDWTPVFRRTPTVDEYILIGEARECGTAETWGYTLSNNTWAKPDKYIPEYERDGFTRIDDPKMSEYQICWADYYPNMHHSSTVIFQRRIDKA